MHRGSHTFILIDIVQYGTSCLHAASENNHLETVKYVIKKGGSALTTLKDGVSAGLNFFILYSSVIKHTNVKIPDMCILLKIFYVPRSTALQRCSVVNSCTVCWSRKMHTIYHTYNKTETHMHTVIIDFIALQTEYAIPDDSNACIHTFIYCSKFLCKSHTYMHTYTFQFVI